MPTVAEVRDKIAVKLGVLAIGQTLSHRYVSDITNAYNETYAMLLKKDLVTWTSTGAIPDNVVEPIVALAAKSRLDEYSVSNEKYSRIIASARNAINEIREIIKDPYFSNIRDAEYY